MIDDPSETADELSLVSFNIDDNINQMLDGTMDCKSNKSFNLYNIKIDLVDDFVGAFNLPKPTKLNLSS